MNSSVSAQASTERTVIDSFDIEFAHLHIRSRTLVDAIPFESFYLKPRSNPDNPLLQSIGECVLKSAGAVERTFGGLTANLWDDPFEWTLPETLSTKELVQEYLEEVEQTRKRAFDRFLEDGNLLKMIAVPTGDARPLVSLLLETFVRATEFQGRAVVMHALLSREKLTARMT